MWKLKFNLCFFLVNETNQEKVNNWGSGKGGVKRRHTPNSSTKSVVESTFIFACSFNLLSFDHCRVTRNKPLTESQMDKTQFSVRAAAKYCESFGSGEICLELNFELVEINSRYLV